MGQVTRSPKLTVDLGKLVYQGNTIKYHEEGVGELECREGIPYDEPWKFGVALNGGSHMFEILMTTTEVVIIEYPPDSNPQCYYVTRKNFLSAVYGAIWSLTHNAEENEDNINVYELFECGKHEQ